MDDMLAEWEREGEPMDTIVGHCSMEMCGSCSVAFGVDFKELLGVDVEIKVMPADDRKAIEEAANGLKLDQRVASVRSGSGSHQPIVCACERPLCEADEDNEDVALVEISSALLSLARERERRRSHRVRRQWATMMARRAAVELQARIDAGMAVKIDVGCKSMRQNLLVSDWAGAYTHGQAHVDAFKAGLAIDELDYLGEPQQSEPEPGPPPPPEPQPQPPQQIDYYRQLHQDYWAWVGQPPSGDAGATTQMDTEDDD